MKKISKKLKIIIFVATILVVMILAIVIIENITKENDLENKGYLETISNADSNLIASYIKEGITIGGITGKLETIDVSNATATEEDVLEGKTFYAGSNDIKIGAMTNSEISNLTVIANAPIYDSTGVSLNTTLDGSTKYKAAILIIGQYVYNINPVINITGAEYTNMGILSQSGYGGGERYTTNWARMYFITNISYPATFNISYEPGWGNRQITLYGIL